MSHDSSISGTGSDPDSICKWIIDRFKFSNVMLLLNFLYQMTIQLILETILPAFLVDTVLSHPTFSKCVPKHILYAS